MAQYIDKDALVAEIERRTDELWELLPDASKVENGSITTSEACNTGKYTALESFGRFLDTLEVKEMKEEPVSEDLEDAVNAYIGHKPDVDESSSVYGKRQAFKAGAQWKKEQFEKNRLAHCDALTKEQAQVESDFVTKHLKENNRTPTFIDAIEYGMELQKKTDAVEYGCHQVKRP